MEVKSKTEAMKERSKQIDLLEKYSMFLEKQGYMDVDWRAEEPYAIDEFLKENPVSEEKEKEAVEFFEWYMKTDELICKSDDKNEFVFFHQEYRTEFTTAELFQLYKSQQND